ncbi:MAG: hypothetical protein MZV63_31660 [Marinilabiliales bacterium]|nr:hypothetical protein [Marinilabiliales bacterium]
MPNKKTYLLVKAIEMASTRGELRNCRNCLKTRSEPEDEDKKRDRAIYDELEISGTIAENTCRMNISTGHFSVLDQASVSMPNARKETETDWQ